MSAIALATSTAQVRDGSAGPAEPFNVPRWAFPGTASDVVGRKAPYDSVERLHVPGSRKSFTRAGTKDQLHPPDWYPASHGRAPDVVMHARPAIVYACGYCHLPDGQGRSENANLAGLRADYITRQVDDFRTGARRSALESAPVTHMIEVAQATTNDELIAAARYFAGLRATPRYTVIERVGTFPSRTPREGCMP